ncbi:glycosyl transferase family 2 [Candidatus Woesearchaeota archaeon]|jgi:glycosyltransferase involved in cell wall biosynthesis|nr:glycosyl transferase family 2 [Candidatus Woesearchaeota archaeon]|tara:strand:+ start:2862 stop:3746 length:885 start_codon:yes stop_codon:yes gene_type:complete
MKTVITIPAYNEEKTIGVLIKNIHEVMKSNDYDYKILVVDDGSKDGTREVAKNAGAIVYSHPRNYGLAETFKTEVNKSLELEADVIMHIDADGQYKPEEIPKLLAEVKKGYDLVLGSRFKGKIESMPLIKRFGNKAFSKVISNITRMKISDGQTGFRAFTREVAKKIKITSGHTYTQEQIIRAEKEKFKIKEVPIYFAKRKDKSRLISNPLGYAIRAWINIIRIYRDYEPLKFFGMIGSLILFVGFILGLYLVYVQLFGVGVNRHLGLMMLNILILSIGLQIIIFGFIADMLKK